MTLNQIITKIREFASLHKAKLSVYVGPESEFSVNKSQDYPVLTVDPRPINVTENEQSYTFSFGVYDRLINSKENRVEVQSDCAQICTDLAKYLDTFYDLTIGENYSVSLIQNKFSDVVAGAEFDLSVSAIYDNTDCFIPVPGSGGGTGGVDILDQFGNVLTTLYPNQKYTVEVLQQIIQTLTDPAPATIIQTLT